MFGRETLRSLLAVIVFTVVLGLIFPLFIAGVGKVFFPAQADGSRITVNGKLIGSSLIGQSFAKPVYKHGKPVLEEGVQVTEADPRYFQSRPSATEGGEYNAAASTFSNLGPNSKLTREADEERIKAYLELNKPYYPSLTPATVPVDAANTSGSNLDPEISGANARIQAHRVATVRHLPLSQVLEMLGKYTSSRFLGFSGEEGVNVLELNLALDRLQKGNANG